MIDFLLDIMHGVRQQMDSLFSTLFAPNQGFFPNRQFFPRPFFPSGPVDSSSSEDEIDFDKLPNNYKNSTSETKVVDGQVVEVNRTVHKISGNNSNGFFQFSVSAQNCHTKNAQYFIINTRKHEIMHNTKLRNNMIKIYVDHQGAPFGLSSTRN